MNKVKFDRCPSLKVADIVEALELARQIRAGGDMKPYKLVIDSNSVRAVIDIDVDNFWFCSPTRTNIVFGLGAKDLDEAGNELLTWKTATVKVTGNGNRFSNLGFFNDRGDPTVNGQQMALEVLGDDNLFEQCHLKSTQDTLFVGHLPYDLVERYRGFLPDRERLIGGISTNYFVACRIEGSVDFVFGTNTVLFYDCLFISVEDGREGPFYIFAPAHALEDDIGYVVVNCSFTHCLSPLKPVYLARPWRDYGKLTIIESNFGEHIALEGYANWEGTERTKTARFAEYPYPRNRVLWSRAYEQKKDRKVAAFVRRALLDTVS